MRVTIELNERGELGNVCTDGEAQVFIVSRHTPHDRNYLLSDGTHLVGVHHVQEALGGAHIGHKADGTISGLSEVTSPKLSPSKPSLRVVGSNADE